MFTGLVEEVGTVAAVEAREGRSRLSFRAPRIAPELAPGDSVAVDGACLTVVEATADGFAVEAIGSTLGRTILGGYRPGTRVNLERALRMGDRLGGHLVQGHVDGVGRLLSVEGAGEGAVEGAGEGAGQGAGEGGGGAGGATAEGSGGEPPAYRLMDFEIPAAVDEVTVLHGSITLNGVSLTVNALPAPGRCQVAIIPHTWEHTNLSSLAPGEPVNVEGDLIGKYVGRILAARGPAGDPATRAPAEPPRS